MSVLLFLCVWVVGYGYLGVRVARYMHRATNGQSVGDRIFMSDFAPDPWHTGDTALCIIVPWFVMGWWGLVRLTSWVTQQ